MKWYPNGKRLTPFVPEHPKADFTEAWKMLNQVRAAIGEDNWYAWMRNIWMHMPNGTMADWTWEQVERVAARKLATVTPEPEECNCNGAGPTCSVCRTKWLDAETLEIEIPF